MLTEDEKNYLHKIPANKKVVVRPYDPKTPEIVEKFSKLIHSVDLDLEIVHLGASSLGISGQGDIDLSILLPRPNFEACRAKLSKVLGCNTKGLSVIEWQFERNGHEVTICLADPNEPSTSRQLKVQEILNQNSKLLEEYEKLKESASSQSYREYQKQKYEFYNKILRRLDE